MQKQSVIDHWLSIEIILEEDGKDDVHLAITSKIILPRKGEYVWMPYNWERKKEFGTRAFIVQDVAHHIQLDAKYPYDSIVVYVSKVNNGI